MCLRPGYFPHSQLPDEMLGAVGAARPSDWALLKLTCMDAWTQVILSCGVQMIGYTATGVPCLETCLLSSFSESKWDLGFGPGFSGHQTHCLLSKQLWLGPQGATTCFMLAKTFTVLLSLCSTTSFPPWGATSLRQVERMAGCQLRTRMLFQY